MRSAAPLHLVTLVTTLLGCSSPRPATACPSDSTTCPDGCDRVEGRRADASFTCLGPEETVGCAVSPSTTLGTPTCLVRKRDGALHWFSGRPIEVASSAAWRDCTDAEKSAVTVSSPTCATH